MRFSFGRFYRLGCARLRTHPNQDRRQPHRGDRVCTPAREASSARQPLQHHHGGPSAPAYFPAGQVVVLFLRARYLSDGSLGVYGLAVARYTIVVTNAGPSKVTGAVIRDSFPSAFTGVTYTATQSGAAFGFNASGSGNINNTITMPPGSKITTRLRAQSAPPRRVRCPIQGR